MSDLPQNDEAFKKIKTRVGAVAGLDINYNSPHGGIHFDEAFESEIFNPVPREPTIDNDGGVHELYDIDYKKVGDFLDRLKIKIIRFIRRLVNGKH